MQCCLLIFASCSRYPVDFSRHPHGRDLIYQHLDLGQYHRVQQPVHRHLPRQGRSTDVCPCDICGQQGRTGCSLHHAPDFEEYQGKGADKGDLARCLFLGPSPLRYHPRFSHLKPNVAEVNAIEGCKYKNKINQNSSKTKFLLYLACTIYRSRISLYPSRTLTFCVIKRDCE